MSNNNLTSTVVMLRIISVILLSALISSCAEETKSDTQNYIKISRADYPDKLAGFWLGQSLANWTGLVTEMDNPHLSEQLKSAAKKHSFNMNHQVIEVHGLCQNCQVS